MKPNSATAKRPYGISRQAWLWKKTWVRSFYGDISHALVNDDPLILKRLQHPEEGHPAVLAVCGEPLVEGRTTMSDRTRCRECAMRILAEARKSFERERAAKAAMEVFTASGESFPSRSAARRAHCQRGDAPPTFKKEE